MDLTLNSNIAIYIYFSALMQECLNLFNVGSIGGIAQLLDEILGLLFSALGIEAAAG
jgi:hypothetical protein